MKLLFLSIVLIPSLIVSLENANSKQETEKTYVELSKKSRIIAGSKAVGKIAATGILGLCTTIYFCFGCMALTDLLSQGAQPSLTDLNNEELIKCLPLCLGIGVLFGYYTWKIGKRISIDVKKAYYGTEELTPVSPSIPAVS